MLLKTRPRDVEETLLQLINDDDQVVAAAAIDVVRQQKMWSLADDIEHVLAHRDVRDWYVFEAASWALAEQRMPAERRRELWLEPLPAAELAGRLRTLPLFASVSVDEIFRIAGASRQTRHEPGTVLLTEGAVPATTHLLLDGRVTASSRTGGPQSIDPPAALGFDEALQGLPMRETVRTADLAVTLALSADELRTLLSDNTDLVSGLFATLADDQTRAAALVISTGATAQLTQLASRGLSPVEKVLALQQVPVFSRVAADEMLALAPVVRTVEMKPGVRLFESSAAAAMWVILSGELSLQGTTDGTTSTVRSGDVVGMWHLLAYQPPGANTDVVQPGIALRLDASDLFDRLEDRPALLQQMFAAVFSSAAPARAVA